MDINFDFNFWSILFLVAGYVLGSFTKRVGKSNEIDQIIRDAAQIQATNRDLEMANDKLNDTLFESTKENQRLTNLNTDILDNNKTIIQENYSLSARNAKLFQENHKIKEVNQRLHNELNSIYGESGYLEPVCASEEGQRP